MKLQINQNNQFHQFNSRCVRNTCKQSKDTALHARRRMMESQEKAQESESVRVTISGEAMSLARQVKAMERIDQFVNARKEQTEDGKESVVLTDEELYEELWSQVKMWGDKTADILHDYNHRETKEMAGERAAALTQMMKLEELQKSEISKMQRDAQKDMVTASMQQEEISRKNSELLMMIESFEEQDEDDNKTPEGKEQSEEKENSSEQPEGSLMEGQLSAGAAKREMGMLYTMNMMDASSTYRIAANDHSVKGIETERKNIYRADKAENFNIKEKIAAMSDFVANLVNDKIMKDLFDERIETAKDAGDEIKQKKLEAMEDYFLGLKNKNQLHDLTEDREFAMQERITARDLRIAHLGDNHFSMAAHQKKELQSLFDEDDIMRLRGQSSVLNRMEDISERLQEKLDERDQIDKDSALDEEIRDNEEQDEVQNQEAHEEIFDKNSYNKELKLNMNHITESPIKVSISQEGLKRSSIQQNGQETYESMMQRREMLKKTRVMNYGYDLSMKAVELNDAASEYGSKALNVNDRANGYIGAYASLYDEIVQGYEDGTREIYVEDGYGMHRLTMEEELKELNESYRRAVDDFVTMEKANEQAYAIVSQEMVKIASISAKSGAAVRDAEGSKAMERYKVPENLSDKMLSAVGLFPQNDAMSNSASNSLSQVLKRVNVS